MVEEDTHVLVVQVLHLFFLFLAFHLRYSGIFSQLLLLPSHYFNCLLKLCAEAESWLKIELKRRLVEKAK